TRTSVHTLRKAPLSLSRPSSLQPPQSTIRHTHDSAVRTIAQRSARRPFGLQSALLGLFERADQRSKSRIAIVSSAANEERRGSVDTALDATHEVFPNAAQRDMLSHLLLELLLDLLHDRVGRPTVGTLVVPVLDEHHSSIGRPFAVVPFSDGQG